MEGIDHEDVSSMNVEIAQVGEKSENRRYRYMGKTGGVDDVRTKRQNEIYMRKKEEARQEVGMALHAHNEMAMKMICERVNKIVCPYENADRERKRK